MRQFIRIPKIPEISAVQLSDVLKRRFPECKTIIKGNDVRVRKNALTTVSVKCKHKDEETILTVNTKMFWWIRLFFGGIFFFISKRGFTDDVYKALLRDLSIMYPSKFNSYPSASESGLWASKTKSIFWVGLGIVVFGVLNCGFIEEILMLIFWALGGEAENVYEFWSLIGVIYFLFWTLLGFSFLRMNGAGVRKRSGVAVIIYGIVSVAVICASKLIGSVDDHLFQDIYSVSISLFSLIVLVCAGCFVYKDLRTGVARYIKISFVVLGIASLVGAVLNRIIFDSLRTDLIDPSEGRVMFFVISAFISITMTFPAYGMLLRALHKMPLYPPSRKRQSENAVDIVNVQVGDETIIN